MYKKAAELWAELRVELLSASAFHSNEKPNPSQLWRMYWSSHQVYEFSEFFLCAWLRKHVFFFLSFSFSCVLQIVISYVFTHMIAIFPRSLL